MHTKNYLRPCNHTSGEVQFRDASDVQSIHVITHVVIDIELVVAIPLLRRLEKPTCRLHMIPGVLRHVMHETAFSRTLAVNWLVQF